MTTVQNVLDEYESKKINIKLPDLDLAKYPEQVYFSEDVSDPSLFNERFIESRAKKDTGSFVLRIMTMSHNFIFVFSLCILSLMIKKLASLLFYWYRCHT